MADTDRTPRRRDWMPLLRIALLVAPWAFIAYLIFRDLDAVRDAFSDASLLLMAAGLALMTVSVLLAAVLWAALVAHLAPRDTNLSGPRMVRAFARSWLARYIPGVAWTYGARFVHTHGDGVPRWAIATSLVDEFALIMGSALAVGAGFWLSAVVSPLLGVPVFVVAIAAVVIGATQGDRLSRGVLGRLGGVLPERWSAIAEDMRAAPSQAGLSATAAAAFTAAYAALAVIVGLSFALVLASLGGVGWGDVPEAIGGYNLAALIAVAVVFVPAGLGVREAAIAAFIAPIVTAPVAASAAVAFRLVSILADVILFAGAEFAGRAKEDVGAAAGYPTEAEPGGKDRG